jgi:uncharacterized protein YxeA
MADNVQIILIIVVSVVVVLGLALWMFKDRLDIFNFTANKKSVSAKMEKHQDTGITISNNTQDGNSNEISTETANVNIEENLQQGDKNRIHAAATSKKK